MAEVLANFASSTLSAGLTNSATSLTVADGSSFSATGNFRIRIDNELILVGARTGNTLSSLTRGIEGTAAVSHLSGATVSNKITAGTIPAFIAEHDANSGAHGGSVGAEIFVANGVPSDADGANGDIYIKADAPNKGLVYRKAAGTWTSTGLNITGATGAAGSNGSNGTNGTNGTNGAAGSAGATGASIIMLPGVPTSGIGNNGDYYVNATLGTTYGPKAAGAWGAITGSLLGPAGPTGAAVSTVVRVSSTSGALELDANEGDVWDVTLTSDIDPLTLATTGDDVSQVTVWFEQDGTGGREITNYAEDVAWAYNGVDNDPPPLSSTPFAVDEIQFAYHKRLGKWMGKLVGNDFISPAPTLDPLDVDIVGTILGTPGQLDASQYVTTQSFNGGAQGAVYAYVITTATGVDPLVPQLAGGGYSASEWQLLGDPVRFDANDTGTRRMLTLHAARATSAGVSAPITVSYRAGNASNGALVAQSGCLLAAVQVDGTPTNGVGLSAANTVGDKATAQGGTAGDSTHTGLTMETPTGGLFLLCVAANQTAAQSAFTPEAGWTLVTGSDITHGSPTVQMYLYTKATTDAVFTGTFAIGVIHAILGTELVDG